MSMGAWVSVGVLVGSAGYLLGAEVYEKNRQTAPEVVEARIKACRDLGLDPVIEFRGEHKLLITGCRKK